MVDIDEHEHEERDVLVREGSNEAESVVSTK